MSSLKRSLKLSLTCFALLGCCLYVGQPHLAGLVLDEQQTENRGHHTNHPGDRQDGPPAVALRQHGGDDGAQAAGQILAAGEDRPPCPELRGLEPLTRGGKNFK